MSRPGQLLKTILAGKPDANFRFRDLRILLSVLGFEERIPGSQHLYEMPRGLERIKLQRDSPRAKPYQVRRIRQLVLEYRLSEKEV